MFLRVIPATAIGMLTLAATESTRLVPDHDVHRSVLAVSSTGTAIPDNPVDSRGADLSADGGFEWHVS
ncbi:hypothetical protein GA0070609_3368 [Micromonospora echinaurantiaca]|uniref:Uncharacterized protein n=1 Tax=Micromonospora echinaurantiaca TaxID=47857 RepID=A0A1C5IJA1_9ACTN|nr:hypothetical protein GA0070609_3368 [Micromonospora echinaurantiaca]